MPVATTERKPGGSRPKPNLELLRARISKGLSRRELADMAGLTEKQVGLIERGVAVNSRPGTLLGLAVALQIDVLELFPVEQRFRR